MVGPRIVASYIPLAVLGAISIFVTILLGIPGVREDKDLIDSYFLYEEERKPFFSSFFRLVKKAFRNKNFIAMLLFMLGTAIFNTLFVSSVPYWVAFIMQADPELELFVYIPYFLAILAPIPLNYY